MPELNRKKVEDAIINNYGVLKATAEECGVKRKELSDFLELKENADLKLLLEQQEEAVLDLAEQKLIESLKKKQAWAIKYYLSTKGRKRGYMQKTEIRKETINFNIEKIKSQMESDPASDPYLRRLAAGENYKKVMTEYVNKRNKRNSMVKPGSGRKKQKTQ